MADQSKNQQSGGDQGAGAPNVARDTDGRGSANPGDGTVDPNVEAVTGAFEGQGSSHDDIPASGLSVDGPDTIDLEDFSGGSRREPGR